MASVMIGSMVCPLSVVQGIDKSCSKPVKVQVTKSDMAVMKPLAVTGAALRHFSNKLILTQQETAREIFERFFQTPEMRTKLIRAEAGTIKNLKGGAITIKKANDAQVRIFRQRKEEDKKWNEAWESGVFDKHVHATNMDVKSKVSCGESVSFRSPFYRKTPKVKKTAKKPVKRVTGFNLSRIATQLMKICGKGLKEVEYTAKRTFRAKYALLNNSTIPQLLLPHSQGIKLRREVRYHQVDEFVKFLKLGRRIRGKICDADVKRGWSGAILNLEMVNTNGRYEDVVVRGRYEGRVIDARSYLPYHVVFAMTHYSGEETFFKGWKNSFDKLAPQTIDHNCQVDHDNFQCGEIAASIAQMMYPCKKMSCEKCRELIKNLTQEEYDELVSVQLQAHKKHIDELTDNISSLDVVFKVAQQRVQVNQNLNASMEILRLVQGHKANQFHNIAQINRVLIKGCTATQKDLEEASENLLIISRWFVNHLNLVSKGDLSTFRNKRASKAMLNPSLICDNQRDKNGNFVWGERGYHSKRLFVNYFEEVQTGEGYKAHIIRKNPNGTRETAIGNLIVPIDFVRAREALRGKSVQRLDLTSKCVARRDNNFVHVCSCVTTDDGKPLYSDIKTPTKSHLVVGSSGDPKLIDLPTSQENVMFVTKDGYCYINIFLAMLVNVNETDAKAFTKMVRDRLIPVLEKWPTMQDVATACYMLTVFYPETRSAELPRILVDHEAQIMHVIDSFGSVSTGYHILKAATVSHLIEFAAHDLQSEMKFYRVGGGSSFRRERLESLLISSIFRPKRMLRLLEDEPYILIMSLVSPKLIIALYNDGALETAMRIWLTRDKSLSLIFSIMMGLAEQASRARFLVEQMQALSAASKQILDIYSTRTHMSIVDYDVKCLLSTLVERSNTDEDLIKNGFYGFNTRLHEMGEKIMQQRLDNAWQELTWLEKLQSITWSLKHVNFGTLFGQKKEMPGSKGKLSFWQKPLRGIAHGALDTMRTSCGRRICKASRRIKSMLTSKAVNVLSSCYKEAFQLVNVLLVFSMILSITRHVQDYVIKNREYALREEEHKASVASMEAEKIFENMEKRNGMPPTCAEFSTELATHHPHILKYVSLPDSSTDVLFQNKSESEMQLEKIVAFVALIAMMYNTEKSDAVFRILNKLKAVFGTLGEAVRYQALDEIQSIDEEKLLTVDFELETEKTAEHVTMDGKFSGWWQNQLEQNRVVPNYRIGGTFIEFSRQTSAIVCNDISLSAEREFLIRGAVGSGKSTGLPAGLSKKGKVLMLEPTRPLAENVCKQLRKEPFMLHPTLRMRGLSSFGSSNITIMTSGFALHYYANNPQLLRELQYVIIDECHVIDASTMAMYCLLREYDFQGKILKVSATPPGKECEFQTQHEVQVFKEDTLSFQQFVQSQGTGANADVVRHGDNILVYVASYNDVDHLSKLLIEKGHFVTKIDGRTMKLGNVEIPTKGTKAKKHFVVATNIIENGVTLDIDVVVDFGMKVVAELDNDSRCFRYTKVHLSYGERIQRLGRVGRVKRGFALRIGHTEKGVTEIPRSTATEAAFLCFAYGLPVMTHNVTTSILANCTVKQARVMMNFELPPFYMCEFVKFNGTMHPVIHNILKVFKIRDSEIDLCKLAIPSHNVDRWITIGDYARIGVQIDGEMDVALPFHARGIPDQIHSDIWKAVREFRGDAGFGRLTSASAMKVAYTLSTEPTAIPRTIALIDLLLAEENQKKAHFEALSVNLCRQNFTLLGLVDSVRRRYLRDHSASNIEILHRARAQILEFQSSGFDTTQVETILNYGLIDTVQYQSKDQLVKRLGLQGRWDGNLITKDVVVSGFVLAGGLWMLWEWFKKNREMVLYQGKRKTQKLKFRDARDKKVGREVFGDDGTIEHFFGAAYTDRGKKKGNHSKRGMGIKTRPFIHLYGLDPTEYSFIRFVDPITGYATDESPTVDIKLLQDEIQEIRAKAMENDPDLHDYIRNKPGIQAYFIKHNSKEALKVDLTPHRPLAMGKNSISVAGYPERESELRQTGAPTPVDATTIPENTYEEVVEEGKSIARGMRNYNPISSCICQLTNSSDGMTQSLYGIGHGPLIITNSHLFKNNNGTLLIKSMHGEFLIPNSTQLLVSHVPKKDMILIRLPKDIPPFPSRLVFRSPVQEEKAVLVGTLFQQKSITSCVSESTTVMSANGSGFWKHWISTKDGDCGLPLVSTRDGAVLGFHGLTSVSGERNYFVPFADNFKESVLASLDDLTWTKHWKHNSDLISWDGLTLCESAPSVKFRTAKLVSDLTGIELDGVLVQGGIQRSNKWMMDSLQGNLKPMAQSTSQLVTKHVIRGECPYFAEYLTTNEGARDYFGKYLNAYQPSRLNQEAYKKDILKYSSVIVAGVVDSKVFEEAVSYVVELLNDLDFGECNYITSEEEIFGSLNMKSAVGALYCGKKRDYLEHLTDEDKSELLKESCKRLYLGQMGIWNGALKAELRSKEKVSMNKTRSFTAAPIDTLLGGKVCVDDFNNRFYTLNMKGPWTVGMTKFYGGWDNLLSQLPEGWIYCDADGSQFDSSLTPYLINAVVTIREFFMEPWDIGLRMLKNFYTEIIYTPILTPDGTIVKKYKGNNSGQPSTVVDNTLMVMITMYYSLIKSGWGKQQIREQIVFFANGDDLIIAIHPDREPFLDNLGEQFLELGLNYTFTSRTRQKQDLWFMSHQGVRIEDQWIPKLEIERIVSILQWDRSSQITHRAEAICASMIEAWGYNDLLYEIRKFYQWILTHDQFVELARNGLMPYISETALKKLYTDKESDEAEILRYWRAFSFEQHDVDDVLFQSEQKEDIDAGAGSSKKGKEKLDSKDTNDAKKERDVDVGSIGSIPRLKKISKMRIPTVKGSAALNLNHLLGYKPEQSNISNARATQQQFTTWFNAVMAEYEVDESQMRVLMNGLMVWCIENGTSPNINGVWVMMDGDEQVEYPLKPVIENAKPTFRQIMHHFSDAAEAYIEMRNAEKPYMPRYGLQRNLRDKTLARYAFDFYEVNSRTTDRAREAHMQMKAAALNNTTNKLFGLDGNVGTSGEDTERHTALDVSSRMHSLLGMKQD
ncbi:polyprotein [Begonia flower breaking virus]|uniref:Genome polyprotein n=2 Tax=Begonia flower breaking virus TaxID=588752 RepID=A0A6B9J0H0_9POTV|nr:polyprotein [Begonia flower breaking virus]QGZ13061.1 polyprotein [Begonia flower breaking virus]